MTFDSEQEKEDKKNEMLKKEFQSKVKEKTYLVAEQLLERYRFQQTALAKQFPFMRANNLWKGMGEVDQNSELYDALNTGSLSIGFVGGANAMYALFDAEHGSSEIAYNTLYETVEMMNEIAEELRKTHKLNYSILATPAESLAGRFLKIDKKELRKEILFDNYLYNKPVTYLPYDLLD